MRYWEARDGTIHLIPRPYADTLCGLDTESGSIVGQVNPSRRGVDVTGLCETCRARLRDRSGSDSTTRS